MVLTKFQRQFSLLTGIGPKMIIGITIKWFMKKYKQGDIILIPYPYTNLSNTKQRPAVIISKDSANRNHYIVAKITSVIREDNFSFKIDSEDIDKELKYPSEVRTNELFTVSPTIIIKKFASLNKESLKRLTEKIKEHITVEWQFVSLAQRKGLALFWLLGYTPDFCLGSIRYNEKNFFSTFM